MAKQESESEDITLEERAEMLVRVNASFLEDFTGRRRRYADQVSTSEALRRRVAQHKATQNGKAH